MDELRFVRRDDHALIVANETGDEFRLIVDDTVLTELRHLGRRDRNASKVRPREIQSLIRAGKSRAEVAKIAGVEEADIERYAEPVLAERRYILELAQAVPVRTDAAAETDQRFGEVIAERLIALGSDTSEWSSWRDEEAGWMISLEFISHDTEHKAIWSFEHRKSVLSPINPDAVNLSKQGDVGDRLIPKLRAVDTGERSGRFDSGAFDASDLPVEEQEDPQSAASEPTEEPEAMAPADPNAEYERRREIDQRAVKTSADEPVDLSQTADLLDALRRRRGEREQSAREHAETPAQVETAPPAQADPHPAPSESSPQPNAPRSIWAAVSAPPTQEPQDHASPTTAPVAPLQTPPREDTQQTAQPDASAHSNSGAKTGSGSSFGLDAVGTQAPAQPAAPEAKPDQESKPKRGRASIPSWDDILFGTRSDED